MGVTIHNYSFPMTFSHKGWRVVMSDETGLFSMKDLKVKVFIDIPTENYAETIAQHYSKVVGMNKNRGSFIYLQDGIGDEKAYSEAYDRYIVAAKKFAEKKGTRTFTLGVNGNMMHRFFGENISAAEKAYKQVIEYIDRNLGDAWSEFLESLK